VLLLLSPDQQIKASAEGDEPVDVDHKIVKHGTKIEEVDKHAVIYLWLEHKQKEKYDKAKDLPMLILPPQIIDLSSQRQHLPTDYIIFEGTP